MTEQFDAHIKQCQTTLEERRKEAEASLQGFFDALASCLQAWIPEKVKAEVTRDHETTTRLGAEKISALKTALTKLTADVPQLVRTWLNEKHLWAHRADYVPGRNSGTIHYRVYSSGSRTGPYELKDPLHGRLREHMVGFMQKHGYLLKSYAGGPPYFAHFDWDSRALDPAMNRYADAFDAFQKAEADFHAAIKAKGEHEAASIWEKS